jgi:hypothetical protein
VGVNSVTATETREEKFHPARCAGWRRVRRSESGRKNRPAPFENDGVCGQTESGGFLEFEFGGVGEGGKGKLETRRQKPKRRR